MAKNFDELPLTTTLVGTEAIPLNQSGTTKRVMSSIFAKAASVVTSINSKTPTAGAISLAASDVGADAAGTASGALTQHLADFTHANITHANAAALAAIDGTEVRALTGVWTPSDVSGASPPVGITGTNCTWTKLGNRVFIDGTLTFGTTADTNVCKVGGLPYNPTYETPGVTNTPSLTYGGVHAMNGSYLCFYNIPGTTQKTNAGMTGVTVAVQLCYKTG